MNEVFLQVDKSGKVKLPQEFLEFWKIKTGDHVLVHRGRETVVLLPTDKKPIFKKKKKESLPSRIMAKTHDAKERGYNELSLEDYYEMFPDVVKPTIRARLTELVKSEELHRDFINYRSVFRLP
jgi:bifunctional DNA-binding transcriptional regulator/antitoxin component of YhaV-PrlF toxin-antitoxin module